MRRREFITLLGGAAVTWPLAAPAQQPGKLPLIGVLVSASPPHPFADAFWRGLHALGYSEGQNIKVEFRYTEGRSDRAEESSPKNSCGSVSMSSSPIMPYRDCCRHGSHANDPDCHGCAWRALAVGRYQ